MTVVIFNATYNKNDIKTTAVITEINRYRNSKGSSSYEVFVKYEIDDKIYENRLNEYSSDFYEGKEIEIYYKKDSPNSIHSDIAKKIIFIVFGAIGSSFMLIGVVGIICIYRKNKNIAKLKQTGELIYADYLRTDINTSIMVNGRYPYNIICAYTNPTDGNKYFFKSANIWRNPEYIIKEKGITAFPVYVSQKSLKKYIVDISYIE